MKLFTIALLITTLPCFISSLYGQSGNILAKSKISSTEGNFSGLESAHLNLGNGLTSIGDLNKDGIIDFATNSFNNITQEGCVFILFMDSNKTVKSYKRIGRNLNGLYGHFDNISTFGNSMASIGDINGDGNIDLIVGNPNGGSKGKGQVYILFLNTDGTVKKYSIIGEDQILIANSEHFGGSVSSHADFDKNGINEILVTGMGNNDGGSYSGIVYILNIDANGGLKSHKKISSKNGNFHGAIEGGFGLCVASIQDLNNDGLKDVIVSSYAPPALWILFLDSVYNVKYYQKIGTDTGGYSDPIFFSHLFGYKIQDIGDIDNNGNSDIAISSIRDSSNGLQTGVVRILLLNSNSTVKSIISIDNSTPKFAGLLTDGDSFGSGLSGGFDFDGDFKNDLIIGAAYTDDGSENKGAIYLLSLDGAVQYTQPKALWRVITAKGNQYTVFNFTQYSSGFPSNYKWSFTPNTIQFQNGTTDTSANPSVKFTQSASYTVQLKVTNPFSSDSLVKSNYINIQTVGLQTLNDDIQHIEIYPNPAYNSITIQSPITMQSIMLFDITGKQMFLQSPNTVSVELDISNLQNGIYFMQIRTLQGTQTHKIIKQ